MKDWKEVDSSSLIEGYRYNPDDRTLHVRFKSNGAEYAYFDVEPEVAGLIREGSEGKDIKRYILDVGYRYKSLGVMDS